MGGFSLLECVKSTSSESAEKYSEQKLQHGQVKNRKTAFEEQLRVAGSNEQLGILIRSVGGFVT